ncbi:unnamed protein product [Ectocarpus sp. 6 AP-2014]
MSFLVDMIGNAMVSLRSKLQQKNERDDEVEERCNTWLFDCATSSTSGIFGESKLELCAMAADSECLQIFDRRAATQRWGCVNSADRACEGAPSNAIFAVAKGHHSSACFSADGYGEKFADFEALSSQGVFAGTASFLGAGLVMVYLARKASTWRIRQQPAAVMLVETDMGQHGVNGVDGTPGRRTAKEGGDAVVEPDQVQNTKAIDLGPRSTSTSTSNNDNNNNKSSVCPKPQAVSTGEPGDGTAEAGGGEGNHPTGGGRIGENHKLELMAGEELQAGSQMPQRLVSEGEKRKPRRWCMEDMVSAEDDGRGKMIGSGSFCEVLKIVMANGVSIAVKAMYRWRQDLGSQDKFIDREIAILQECNVHPYVVDIFGYIRTTERVLIIMPMAMTDLKTMLKVKPFSNLETQHFIRQLLSALEFLHSRHIVQRDIKPHNLLLPDGSGVGGAPGKKLLLADFGLSKKLSDEHGFLTDVVGTKPYMAPELLRSDDADLKYGKKVDVWAAGVVTHELLACVTPFRHGEVANVSGLTNDATDENGVQEAKGDRTTPAGTKTREQLEDDIAYEAEKNNIREGRAIYDSSLVSVECLRFLKQLLQVDDSKRPSAREAADHPWLGGPEQAAAMRASVSAEVEAREAAEKAEKDSLVRRLRRGPRMQKTAMNAAAAAAAAPVPPSARVGSTDSGR